MSDNSFRKILIVDDNDLFRKSLKTFLEKHRFEVTGDLTKIKDALLSIEGDQPDVLILDLVMPGQDTLKFINHLNKKYPSLSIIICSSLKEEHVVTRVLETYVFDYIFKPFKEERLLESLKQIILFKQKTTRGAA